MRPNNKMKKFDFFTSHSIKMEQEALYFGTNGIIKNAFHKNENPTNINEVDIKRIVLFDKKSLDIDIKVMLFHHYYV